VCLPPRCRYVSDWCDSIVEVVDVLFFLRCLLCLRRAFCDIVVEIFCSTGHEPKLRCIRCLLPRIQSTTSINHTTLLREPSKLFACTQIRARDTRLGGWLKPVVGVCQIDLAHKIPWCEDTYIPPATDIFFQPEAAGVIEGVPGNDPGDKVGACCWFAVATVLRGPL
jgi:hypothetical protein